VDNSEKAKLKRRTEMAELKRRRKMAEQKKDVCPTKFYYLDKKNVFAIIAMIIAVLVALLLFFFTSPH